MLLLFAAAGGAGAWDRVHHHAVLSPDCLAVIIKSASVTWTHTITGEFELLARQKRARSRRRRDERELMIAIKGQKCFPIL